MPKVSCVFQSGVALCLPPQSKKSFAAIILDGNSRVCFHKTMTATGVPQSNPSWAFAAFVAAFAGNKSSVIVLK
jgi:hypothetical protein